MDIWGFDNGTGPFGPVFSWITDLARLVPVVDGLTARIRTAGPPIAPRHRECEARGAIAPVPRRDYGVARAAQRPSEH